MYSMCSCFICAKISVLAAAGVTQLTRMFFGREFLAQRFRQPDQAGLRGAVMRGSWDSFLAGNRGDVDDAAVAVGEEMGDRPRGRRGRGRRGSRQLRGARPRGRAPMCSPLPPAMPALLTRMSMRPCFERVASTAEATDAASVSSTCSAETTPCADSSARADSSLSRSTSHRASVAPDCSARLEIA